MQAPNQFSALLLVALAILVGIPRPVAAQSSTDPAGPNQLVLTAGDRKLAVYNAGHVPSPDPGQPWYGRSGFLHPVYTPNGKIVTDAFPADHLHQHGLMFAWTSAQIDGRPVDFWNSKKQQGHVEHVETVRASQDRIEVRLRHMDDTADRPTAVLNETWTVTRVPHPDLNVFDLQSEQLCLLEKGLQIRKYHYGGMCVRGPAAWVKQVTMLTSEGKGQKDGNHTRPHWVAMAGTVDGEECGLAAMSHPGNFRATQHVRLHPDKPYFCFAPMVAGGFTMDPGQPFVSRYRFVTFDGPVNPAELDVLWKSFADKK